MIIGRKASFAFELDAVAPSWEIRYPSECAGWAGLAVWIDGDNVCRHVAPGTDRLETRVFVPTGPLADWVVRSWPAIACEERPSSFPLHRDPRETYQRWARIDPPSGMSPEAWYDARWEWWSRHFLDAESQGSVLPDLSFVRDANRLIIGWAAVCSRSAGRQARGCHSLPWAEACAVFEELVAVVSDSFREAGRANTFSWVTEPCPLTLSKEALRGQLSAYVGRSEPELRALLGVSDTADLYEALRIIGDDPGTSVVSQILRDLPPTADASLVHHALELDQQMHGHAPAAELKRVRSLGAEIQREQATPEQQGHAAAAALRRDLGLDGRPIPGGRLSHIVEGCGLRLREAEEPAVGSPEVRSFVACSEERGSLLYLRQTPALKKSWARRFEICRGLGVSMLDPYRSGLLGRASSPWSSSYVTRRRFAKMAGHGITRFVKVRYSGRQGRRGLKRVFGFDHHFTLAGFDLWPS